MSYRSPSSSSASSSVRGHRPNPGKTVMAEVPVTLAHRHSGSREKQRPPQEKLDEFWSKFTTKAPGKATTILPRKDYGSPPPKKPPPRSVGGGHTTQASFEEAAVHCRAKVAQIVKECRRVNQRYRDPHFDLELDFQLERRDCLDSLNNMRDCHSGARRPDMSAKAGVAGDGAGGEDLGPDHQKTEGDGGRGRGRGRGRGVFTPGFGPKAVKRVVDIFDNPQLYIDGPTANDVRQGRDVGDCWLMAALCTMSNKPGLIERICVDYDQAVGVYGFVFHRDGEWFSEVIDDKLYLSKPDYDDGMLERILWDDRERTNSEEAYRKIYQSNSGALYFSQCENPNETWLPLLEKAYAKAHGDYEAIEGGFTGEGIEDLTGGVTSEIYTTDILDREHFWREELMRVNQDFLFGCSTGVWGRGVGERKGIVELHAYSVMRAVEIDGTRLVLLKNPWGKGEWKGPWSDGSREWTAEWLARLNHRFGDDGAFWISYQDLLRKYQAFDRTRLFGPEWKVTAIWATLSVPWTLEYHDTKFSFSLARAGPVVLVLSQLDDRYFQGLQGQYRFELGFRLHAAGEPPDEYIVRSQAPYRMNRSVNVELDLPAGDYIVLVKIDALRDSRILPPEDVVRANAKRRREKLTRVALAYDLAHAKGRIVESPEEKEARLAAEKRRKAKDKREFREKIMRGRHEQHYIDSKDLEKRRRKNAKAKAKMAAKQEKRKARAAERKAKKEEERKKEEQEQIESEKKKTEKEEQEPKSKEKQQETETVDKEAQEVQDKSTQQQTKGDGKDGKEEGTSPLTVGDSEASATTAPTDEQANKATDPSPAKDNTKDSDSSSSTTGPGVNTPTTSNSQILGADPPPPVVEDQGGDGSATEARPPSPKPLDTSRSEQGEGNMPATATDVVDTTDLAKTDVKNASESQPLPEPTTASSEAQDPKEETKSEESKLEEGSRAEGHGSSANKLIPAERRLTADAATQAPEDVDGSGREHDSAAEVSIDVHRQPRPRARTRERLPSPPRYIGRRPQQPHFEDFVGSQAININTRRYNPQRAPPPGWRGPPMPPGAAEGSDVGSEVDPDDSSDDGLSSISSVSDISERELDMRIEMRNRVMNEPAVPGMPPGPPRPVGPSPPPGPFVAEDTELEKDPWNAVAVVGLRVYYKLAEGEDKDTQVVKLRVDRPNPWLQDDSEDEDEGGNTADGEATGKKKKKKEKEIEKAEKVLDVDDSARDAALDVAKGEDDAAAAGQEGKPVVEEKRPPTDAEHAEKEKTPEKDADEQTGKDGNKNDAGIKTGSAETPVEEDKAPASGEGNGDKDDEDVATEGKEDPKEPDTPKFDGPDY